MRLYSALVAFCVFAVSCITKTDTADSDLHPNYLEGEFAIGDATIEQFHLWGCFCNLTDSAIRITNINSGFEGQQLVVIATKSDTVFSFDTWTCVGRPPEYAVEKHTLILDDSIFLLQDSLTGKIIVTGSFIENEKVIDLKIAGHFKCILRDSLYDFQAYQADIVRMTNKREMEKLTKLSNSRPDSVLEK